MLDSRMVDSAATPSLGRLTRRPAVSAAVLLIVGILLHAHVPRHPWLLLAGSAFLALFAAVVRRHHFISNLSIATVLVLLGIGLAQREHFQFADDDIGLYADEEPRLTELQLHISDDPQIFTSPTSQSRQLPPKQTTIAQVLQVKTWSGWQPASGRVPVQIDEPSPALAAGQTVRALGMLQRLQPAMNPGEFDRAAFYRQDRILSTFTIRRVGNIHVLSDPGPSPVEWLRGKTRHLLAAGFTQDRAADHDLLAAILLGDRLASFRDEREEFEQIGVGYQLTVSGLHIAMLAAVVFWLCRAMHFRPRLTLAISAGFVLLYTAVSFPSHSGTRAIILCVVAAAAVLAGRTTDRAQLLSLAIIAMLLWHPLDLYSSGFHLSFAVVIVFVILMPPLRQWWINRQNPDQIVLAKMVARMPLHELRRRLIDWLLTCLMYSLLAWLSTLPLVVYYFGQASSWSILVGLLLLPVVAVALFGGMLKILFTGLWPMAGHLWAIAAGSPARVLLWSVHHLARLPASSVSLPAPSLWLIFWYYVLLFSPLWPVGHLLKSQQRWVLRLGPVAAVSVIFLLPFFRRPPISLPGDLRFTLLSVGAGQCAVLEPPGGHAVLFDAGSSTISDVDRRVIEPYLHVEEQSQVDRIFLSHGDFDHISAAGEIASAFDVQEVLTSYHFRKNSAGNIPDQQLLDELEKIDRAPREIALGDQINLHHGILVDVLWPPKTGNLNSNNAGLVLRITYAGRSILLPADIQDPAFIGVLKNAAALKSDVLVAPHHGSSEEMTSAFVTAVHPGVILSSNAARLTSKQRRFQDLVGHTPLFRTPEFGAITVTIHADGTITVSPFIKGLLPFH